MNKKDLKNVLLISYFFNGIIMLINLRQLSAISLQLLQTNTPTGKRTMSFFKLYLFVYRFSFDIRAFTNNTFQAFLTVLYFSFFTLHSITLHKTLYLNTPYYLLRNSYFILTTLYFYGFSTVKFPLKTNHMPF